ncbi:MAG: hypothetical protein IIU08_00905, partial [Clostridia bacterium]|nr:hypothetical protein [Clostridia bacterium]
MNRKLRKKIYDFRPGCSQKGKRGFFENEALLNKFSGKNFNWGVGHGCLHFVQSVSAYQFSHPTLSELLYASSRQGRSPSTSCDQ